jgi:prepilin-type N-terminal cleavage/methylation domain-containing protein/prepilin-type processing-associated H-X9-DG protein
MKKGFTLIELLVVISIISLLMSIMLPGLSNSRELAKRVTCGSNLRQFYFIWNIYSMNNDDRLCSPDTLWTKDDHGIPGEKGANWVADGPMVILNDIGGKEQALKEGVLWQYDLVTKLFKCKSDGSDFLRSYSMPLSMGGKSDGCVPCGSGYVKSYSSQGIPRASEKIVFMDAEPDPSGLKWLDGPFKLLMEDSQPMWGCNSAYRVNQRITLRHTNGSNFVFGDGSASYHKWKDQRTIDFYQGKISSAAEASKNNDDLKWLFDAIRGD